MSMMRMLVAAMAGLLAIAAGPASRPAYVIVTDHSAVIAFGAHDADMALLDSHPEINDIQFGGGAEDWIGPLPAFDITDAGFAHVGHCRQLQSLTIQSIFPLKITDAAFASLHGMDHLKVIRCSDLAITDAAIAHLAGLTQLQELSLDGNHDLGDGTLAVAANLPRLRVLRLYSARAVTDAGIRQIKPLVDLEDLQLGNTTIGDGSMATIATFTKLKTLDLQNTWITDAGLARLGGLHLQWLCLNGTPISDAGLQSIAKMTELRDLFLQNTRIDDVGVARLSAMPQLQSLHLSGTRITDAAIASLLKLKSLKTLDASRTRMSATGLSTFKSHGITVNAEN